jgi:hypothetical protein
MKNLTYQPLSLDYFIPLHTDVYCDYNKQEVINYCISKKNSQTLPKYFNNQKRFYVPRTPPYIVSPTREHDKERIKIIINDIAFSNLENRNQKQNKTKINLAFYNPIEIEDFLYIVGNKDWFIGITKKRQIIKYYLTYDKRGLKEYQKYEKTIQDVLKNLDQYISEEDNYKVKKALK